MDEYDVVYGILSFVGCIDLMRFKLINRMFYCVTKKLWSALVKETPSLCTLYDRSPLMNKLLFGQEKQFDVPKNHKILFVDDLYLIVTIETSAKSKFRLMVFSCIDRRKIFSHSSKNETLFASINYPYLLLLSNFIKVFNLLHQHRIIGVFENFNRFWLFNNKLLLMKTGDKYITLTTYNLDKLATLKKFKVTNSYDLDQSEISSTILVKDRFLFVGTYNGLIAYIDLSNGQICPIDFKVDHPNSRIIAFYLTKSEDILVRFREGVLLLTMENNKFSLSRKIWCYFWELIIFDSIVIGKYSSEWLFWKYKEPVDYFQSFPLSYNKTYLIKDYYFLDNENILFMEGWNFKFISKNDHIGSVKFDLIWKNNQHSEFFDIITQKLVKSFKHPVKIFDEKWVFWWENDHLVIIV